MGTEGLRGGIWLASALCAAPLLAAPHIAACGDAGEGEDCHNDCFGSVWCEGGQVYRHEHAPIPCDEDCYIWIAYRCEIGCAIEPSAMLGRILDQESSMCAGAPSRMPGDRCLSWTDCYPPPSRVSEYGTITEAYLECDIDTRTCVSRDKPRFENWLAPCTAANAFAGARRPGYTIDYKDCWTGVCLFADDPLAGCVRQGCSLWCNEDAECPEDATCDDWLEKDDVLPGDERFRGVCKPGPPGDVSLLPCP